MAELPYYIGCPRCRHCGRLIYLRALNDMLDEGARHNATSFGWTTCHYCGEATPQHQQDPGDLRDWLVEERRQQIRRDLEAGLPCKHKNTTTELDDDEQTVSVVCKDCGQAVAWMGVDTWGALQEWLDNER